MMSWCVFPDGMTGLSCDRSRSLSVLVICTFYFTRLLRVNPQIWLFLVATRHSWLLLLTRKLLYPRNQQLEALVPVLNQAPRHEGVLGSGGIAPRILDLSTRWRWVVSFTPRPLYPQGKSPWYPLDRRLGGLQSRSGRSGEEKNSQPMPGIEP
jgi:hypothetical protein